MAKKHGHYLNDRPSPTYKCWQSMVGRCYHQTNSSYKNYGGKGITVCKEWKNNFSKFLEDMGERPLGMTLDRIDNSLGYNKENCRWRTMEYQQNHRSNNIKIEFKNNQYSIKQIANILEKSTNSIYKKLYRGIDLVSLLERES